MEKILQNGFRLVAVVAITLSLVFGATTVKAGTVNCAAVCDSAALTAAITAAVDGDVIEVPAGTHPLTTLVTVNKDVTIHGAGESSTIFEISGSGTRMSLTADGASLENFAIYKTDKTAQSPIIAIAANNLTLSSITVHGNWKLGDSETVRGLVTNVGKSGLTIENSSFYNLRQPGYVDTNTGVTIRNTYVAATRGWVVDDADITFTGNTWGTGADKNAVDIAIIPGTTGTYIPDILAASKANNNAVIEDQRVSPSVFTSVWVDDSNTNSKDLGYWFSPLPSLQVGIDRVVAGGNVIIAAGTYSENANLDTDLLINKSVSLLGAGKDQTIVRMNDGKISGLEINGVDAEISINHMSFLPKVGSVDAPEYGILFGAEQGSFASIMINEVAVQGTAVANLAAFETSTFGNFTIEDSDFTLGQNMGVDLAGPFDYLNIARSTVTDNGNATSGSGGGLYMPKAKIASLYIHDSDFSRNVQRGIEAGEIQNASFSRIKANGTLGGSETAGLTIFVDDESTPNITASNISISSSEFLNNSHAGIQLISSDDPAVAGIPKIDDLTIVSSRFAENVGPAIYSWSGGAQTDIKIHHNSLLTPAGGTAILNEDDAHAILAENNWYGCNAGPNQPGCGTVTENVDANPWLVLKPVVASLNVLPATPVDFTASLNFNNAGVDTSLAGRGTYPDGISVGFTADLGTVDPVSDTTLDGVAVTSFTAPVSGVAEVCAVLDSETQCLDLTVVDPAPVGVEDTYEMNQMETLTVPAATGVLANDTDGNGDTLTAVLVSAPTHGELTLNADGSFVYTPSRYWSGTDTFTYKANDGTNDSADVTVTITVAEKYSEYIFMPIINR